MLLGGVTGTDRVDRVYSACLSVNHGECLYFSGHTVIKPYDSSLRPITVRDNLNSSWSVTPSNYDALQHLPQPQPRQTNLIMSSIGNDAAIRQVPTLPRNSCLFVSYVFNHVISVSSPWLTDSDQEDLKEAQRKYWADDPDSDCDSDDLMEPDLQLLTDCMTVSSTS